GGRIKSRGEAAKRARSAGSRQVSHNTLHGYETYRLAQCDEVKPKCGQCSKALHNCSFESSTLSSDLDTPANASHDALNRGQSSKNSKANGSRHDMPQSDYSTRHNQQLGVPVASSSSSTLSHASSPGSSTSAGPDSLLLGTSLKGLIPWIWTVDDLALLHHFLTCPALDHGDAILWRQKVPLLAFENVTKSGPTQYERTRYRGLADKHYETGLRQTMELMPRLSLDSAGVLYIATTLICSCSFARGPAPGNLLIVSNGVEVAWFELLRGVRLVIETVGFEAIFSGVLAPTPSEEKPPPRKDPSGQASVSRSSPTASRPVTWEHALGRIAQLIADTADPDEATYRKMIQYVSSAF
ncbi:hypothetical protein CCUS01_06431, partial [Colletotrichum cuscutae]